MRLNQLLPLSNIACSVQSESKKKLLTLVSQLAARQLTATPQQLFDALLLREHIGNTSIGNGIALPHAKLYLDCFSTKLIMAYFLQLREGIEFNAIDNQPVDLIFVLFISEASSHDHQKILFQIGDYLSNKRRAYQLRQAKTNQALYQIFMKDNILLLDE